MSENGQDDELRAAVATAPDAEARAILLGVDLPRAIQAEKGVKRGRLVLALLVAIPVIVVMVPSMMTDVFDSAREGESAIPWAGFVEFLLGTLLGTVAQVVALVMPYLVGWMMLSRGTVRTQQLVAGTVAEISRILCLFFLVIFAPSTLPYLAGIMLGAGVGGTIVLAGVSSLTLGIIRNHPRVVPIVRQHQSLPDWQTLIGGESKWIVWSLAAMMASDVAAVILIWMYPLAVVPLVAAAVATSLVSTELGLRNKPRQWLAPQIVFAGLVIVAAIVASL